MDRGLLYLVVVRLGKPGGAVVANVEYDGQLVPRVSARRWAGALRPAKIFDTDQGSEFTSAAFTGVLVAGGSEFRWTGVGGVFIERLWRSLKQEKVYLMGYADGREAHAGISVG